MRILVHYNGTYSETAGVSRVVLGLGKALEKHVEIDYVFGYDAPKGMYSYLNSLKGPFHFLRHTPITAILFAIFIRNKDYDIIHSHTPEGAFDAVLARFLLRKKYKVLVHLHGLDKAVRQEWKKELALKRANHGFADLYLLASVFKAYFAMKMADAFVSVSRTVAQEAQKFYNVQPKILPNTVNCAELKKIEKAKARKELGLAEKDFVVLFVGNASWIKGLHYLVEALKEIEQAKLLIVGLAENNEPWIKNALGNRVHFSGYLDRKELSKYYSAADVLCVPSLYEPFGLVYAEAQCFGLPCIASKGTGAEETIKHGKNGFLVEKRNVAQIKAALQKLQNSELRRKMAQKALENAKGFSWRNATKELLKIYENLIA